MLKNGKQNNKAIGFQAMKLNFEVFFQNQKNPAICIADCEIKSKIYYGQVGFADPNLWVKSFIMNIEYASIKYMYFVNWHCVGPTKLGLILEISNNWQRFTKY